eukprot:jgi/Mesvir1/27613/Mv07347-RA.1
MDPLKMLQSKLPNSDEMDDFLNKVTCLEKTIAALKDGTLDPSKVPDDIDELVDGVKAKSTKKSQQKALAKAPASDDKNSDQRGHDVITKSCRTEPEEPQPQPVSLAGAQVARDSAHAPEVATSGGAKRTTATDYDKWRDWNKSTNPDADELDVSRLPPETRAFMKSIEDDCERRERERREDEDQANVLKNQGNEWYKRKDYDKAVAKYTAALKILPSSHIILANRAQAYLKLNRHADAIADCDKALALDARNVKALHRRGLARMALGATLEAVTDFEKALRWDPGNADATAALASAKRALVLAAEEEAVMKARACASTGAMMSADGQPSPTAGSVSELERLDAALEALHRCIREAEEAPTSTPATAGNRQIGAATGAQNDVGGKDQEGGKESGTSQRGGVSGASVRDLKSAIDAVRAALVSEDTRIYLRVKGGLGTLCDLLRRQLSASSTGTIMSGAHGPESSETKEGHAAAAAASEQEGRSAIAPGGIKPSKGEGERGDGNREEAAKGGAEGAGGADASKTLAGGVKVESRNTANLGGALMLALAQAVINERNCELVIDNGAAALALAALERALATLCSDGRQNQASSGAGDKGSGEGGKNAAVFDPLGARKREGLHGKGSTGTAQPSPGVNSGAAMQGIGTRNPAGNGMASAGADGSSKRAGGGAGSSDTLAAGLWETVAGAASLLDIATRDPRARVVVAMSEGALPALLWLSQPPGPGRVVPGNGSAPARHLSSSRGATPGQGAGDDPNVLLAHVLGLGVLRNCALDAGFAAKVASYGGPELLSSAAAAPAAAPPTNDATGKAGLDAGSNRDSMSSSPSSSAASPLSSSSVPSVQGKRRVVELLASLLASPYSDVRERAAGALGNLSVADSWRDELRGAAAGVRGDDKESVLTTSGGVVVPLLRLVAKERDQLLGAGRGRLAADTTSSGGRVGTEGDAVSKSNSNAASNSSANSSSTKDSSGEALASQAYGVINSALGCLMNLAIHGGVQGPLADAGGVPVLLDLVGDGQGHEQGKGSPRLTNGVSGKAPYPAAPATLVYKALGVLARSFANPAVRDTIISHPALLPMLHRQLSWAADELRSSGSSSKGASLKEGGKTAGASAPAQAKAGGGAGADDSMSGADAAAKVAENGARLLVLCLQASPALRKAMGAKLPPASSSSSQPASTSSPGKENGVADGSKVSSQTTAANEGNLNGNKGSFNGTSGGINGNGEGKEDGKTVPKPANGKGPLTEGNKAAKRAAEPVPERLSHKVARYVEPLLLLVDITRHDSLAIATNASLCLAELAREKEGIAALCSRASVTALVALMSASDTGKPAAYKAQLPAARKNAAIALARMAQHEGCLELIREMKGIEMMHSILQDERRK